jgi:hypothetical protein
VRLTKKHLQQVLDEARKNYINISNETVLFGDTRPLSEAERFALSYLKAVLTLGSVQVSCAGHTETLTIEIDEE